MVGWLVFCSLTLPFSRLQLQHQVPAAVAQAVRGEERPAPWVFAVLRCCPAVSDSPGPSGAALAR